MTELNTLGDLEFEHEWNEAEKPLAVWSDDLRKEAVKYIKFLQDIIDDVKSEVKRTSTLTESGIKDEVKEECEGEIHVINWIRHFFDLKEEDLK